MKIIIKNVLDEKIELLMYWLEKGQTIKTPYEKLEKDGNNMIMDFKKDFPGKYEIVAKEPKGAIKEREYIVIVNSTSIQSKSKTVTFEIKKKGEENEVYNYNTQIFNKEKLELRKKVLLSNTKHWNLYWLNLHWLTHKYPETPTEAQQQQIKDLISIMRTKDGLQCPKCRGHFDKYVTKNDPTEAIKSQTGLFTYFWEVHNDVNNNNKKKHMSLEDAKKLYSIKDWGKYLENYGGNILDFFEKGELKNFPLKFNSEGRVTVRQEFFKK